RPRRSTVSTTTAVRVAMPPMIIHHPMLWPAGSSKLRSHSTPATTAAAATVLVRRGNGALGIAMGVRRLGRRRAARARVCALGRSVRRVPRAGRGAAGRCGGALWAADGGGGGPQWRGYFVGVQLVDGAGLAGCGVGGALA